MKNDFFATFMVEDKLNEKIGFVCKEFEGNGKDYPKHNLEDTNKLLNTVRSELANEGLKVLDVCAIIAHGGEIVWSE